MYGVTPRIRVHVAVNIRKIPKTWANKRDWGHRPMAVVTRAAEITLPVAIVAAAYIIGQGLVDAGKDG